ncbi:Maf family protein [Mobilicoccus pelagius]|uniref:Nucleoside triphosphate pyrophosphatase n=1 Tax=Mobilicoccus pelagius NBRC 104925 TaxID=1089455 RepID=H5UN30_9MICO|nr:Maf family protein [Mobilicoccus pelagius]GAB47138.1 putative Maf-like protein [Mobilicoccus pelagius NBRC 104925]
MTTVPFCLASASPARLTTFRHAGVEPHVVVSGVDEDAAVADATERLGELGSDDIALLLARAKCEDVAARLEEEEWDGLVLGCDSVLEFDGRTYGKPVDAAHAASRWQGMRGRSGVLHTGHWVIDLRDEGTGATLGAVCSTTVHFADLSDEEIEAYVATGEPLKAAGAFTIDGIGGPYVTGIEGDHHNVVGVSLPLVRELLSEIDVPWHHLRQDR